MFYLFYTDNGVILSVSNSDQEEGNILEIDTDLFEDFSEGRKQIIDYKVIEDAKENGQMHVVPTNINFVDQYEQKKGQVPKNVLATDCIEFIQESNSWRIKNKLAKHKASMLNQNEYVREYFVVDESNRFILVDKFTVNLQETLTNDVIIKGHSSDKNVRLMCFDSYLKHVHTSEMI
tara:strand:+ start:573 stop:1103 length:531 start_codon:yes stop_codon:yes gene_type:complete